MFELVEQQYKSNEQIYFSIYNNGKINIQTTTQNFVFSRDVAFELQSFLNKNLNDLPIDGNKVEDFLLGKGWKTIDEEKVKMFHNKKYKKITYYIPKYKSTDYNRIMRYIIESIADLYELDYKTFLTKFYYD